MKTRIATSLLRNTLVEKFNFCSKPASMKTRIATNPTPEQEAAILQVVNPLP